MVDTNYPGLLIEKKNQVATVRVRPISEMTREEAARADIHWELGRIFSDHCFVSTSNRRPVLAPRYTVPIYQKAGLAVRDR